MNYVYNIQLSNQIKFFMARSQSIGLLQYYDILVLDTRHSIVIKVPFFRENRCEKHHQFLCTLESASKKWIRATGKQFLMMSPFYVSQRLHCFILSFMKSTSYKGEFFYGSHVYLFPVKFHPVDVAAAWGGYFFRYH